jgi:hypothetical protein
LQTGYLQTGYLQTGYLQTGYLQTKVVTDEPASEAEKAPPVTATAVCETRLAFADVSHGVHEAGAVPPATLSGTDTVVVPLLMATTTTVFDPEYADSRTFAGAAPETFTRTYPGRTNLLKLPSV